MPDETLAAILREMRGNEFDDPHLDADGIIGARRLARDWADRIEAAAERERVEIRRDAEIEWTRIGYDERKAEEKRAPGNAAAPPESPSNAAKMREALEYAREVLTLNGFVEPVVRCDAALAKYAARLREIAGEGETPTGKGAGR